MTSSSSGTSTVLERERSTLRYPQARVIVLDDDIKALLFDSWYTGADNMSALEALPGRNRVELQMRKMDRTLKANC